MPPRSSTPPERSRPRIGPRLFLVLFALYAFYAQEGYGANANRYVALVHAVLLEGRLEIDTWHETTGDTAWVEGHWYAGAAPGPALVLLPFYAGFRALYPLVPAALRERIDAAARARIGAERAPVGFDLAEFALSVQVLTALVPPLAGAALGVLLFVWFRRRVAQERDALLLALFAGLGTIVFHYSTVIFSHVLAALCAFGAFALLDPRGPRVQAGRALAAGALASAATSMDYLAVSATLLLGLLAAVHLAGWRERLAFGCGLALPALALAGYHALAFGHPLLTPYSFPAEPGRAGAHEVVSTGFFGLGAPRAWVLGQLAGGLRRGYFVHMPVLLAGVAGLLVGLRRAEAGERGSLLAAAAIVAAFFLFNASMRAEYFWIGATSFGPRYLIPSIPFAAAGLAWAWQGGAWARRLTAVLGLASLLVNWLGAQIGASDEQTPFPLLDRFVPAFLEHGPQSTILANLATLVPLGAGTLQALNALALALLASVVYLLLRPVLRAR